MTLPFDALAAGQRELGLVLAVGIGVGFGFVLERAGFGRATKLAAQFYLHDMTVFKVMFTSIVTAMLGLVVAGGVGFIDLAAVATSGASWTFVGPMIVGGLLLGVGFIVSGYCPGTSVVGAASGNLDALFAFGGVVVGSLLFAEVYPLVADFHVSSNLEHLFLYEVLGLSPATLALAVTVAAVGCFVGAEYVERIFQRRRSGGAEPAPAPRAPRRAVFATLGGVAVLGVLTLALPAETRARAEREARSLGVEALAHKLLEEPWSVRVLDLRDEAACAQRRVPGAECVPTARLADLGLAYARGGPDLVLVGSEAQRLVPAAARTYPGEVWTLDGGFDAWRQYALTPPEALPADATAQQREAWHFRAALHGSLTGTRQAPPPRAAATKYVPKKKKKGGGCD